MRKSNKNENKGLSMDTSNYNQSLTTKLYVAAGVLFGTYGSRVCPMLETLTTLEIFTQVSIVFVLVWLTRHFLLAKHALVEQGRFAQLDTLLFLLRVSLSRFTTT